MRENKITKMILDETILDIYDGEGKAQEITLRQFLAIGREKIIKDDRALGIQRKHLPFQLILYPHNIQTQKCVQLASRIDHLAQYPIIPDTPELAASMRCNQFYWHVFAVLLANLIYPSMDDEDYISKTNLLLNIIPEKAQKQALIMSETYFAFYQLIKAGKTRLIGWADKHNIDYPWQREGDDITELFLEILKMRFFILFEIKEEEKWSIERQIKNHRDWIKFFSDIFEKEKIIQVYEDFLWTMGWEGYAILALRKTKADPQFALLWQKFIKTQRQYVEILKEQHTYWHNELPYKTFGTRTRYPVTCQISEDGYFDWQIKSE